MIVSVFIIQDMIFAQAEIQFKFAHALMFNTLKPASIQEYSLKLNSLLTEH